MLIKKLIIYLLFLIVALDTSALNTVIIDVDTLKIACIGNSITYGSGVVNREKNAYPAQLQELLGSLYEVRNFGVSGTTLLKHGDLQYWKTQAYKKVLEYKPDIVFIMLGTNDSKRKNRIYLTDFKQHYTDLIHSFKRVNKNVRVVLLLPIPSFAKDSSQIWNPVIKDQIIPFTREVAYNTGSEIIDLYQLFVDQEDLVPDKIHPSSLGATVIAKRMFETIHIKRDEQFNIVKSTGFQNGIKSNFYGFEQIDFNYKGVACKIVVPKRSNKKHNWVWRARFWGHEPQTDIALLERGFHIVYCDVANLFGSKEAVSRWDSFYALMRKNGLSAKVALEGMSRGGLIIYNWALENPTKIACIYADAPVLDGKSWPGGFGKSDGSKIDWETFKKQYNLNSEASILEFEENPLYKATKIANLGFSILHICGDADKVVPISENTKIFEINIKEAGGSMDVIYKKGIGHHPHSLQNATPIVDFILRATANKINFASIAIPGSEYRSAAGWKKNKGWWAQKNEIDSLCESDSNIDILLIGNSITQGWGGSRTLVTYKPGLKAAEKYFGDLKWINAGISGDRTEHTAFRILNGTYELAQPKLITLAIGVNNFPFNNAEEIADGIENNIELLTQKFPKSIILLCGPLPTGLKNNSERREKYNKIHQLISKFDNPKNVHYFNLLHLFADKHNNLKEEYYSGDGIHLKPEGYNVWGNFIKIQIDQISKL